MTPRKPSRPAGPAKMIERALATPAPAAAAPAAVLAVPRPRALSLETRRSLQLVLARIEQTTPALREAGAFELLGLVLQAGHALKLTAEHSHALERALGLEPGNELPPAAPATSPTNGVPS